MRDAAVVGVRRTARNASTRCSSLEPAPISTRSCARQRDARAITRRSAGAVWPGRRAAAHRGHAEAEAARDCALGGADRRRGAPPLRRSPAATRRGAVVAALRARAHRDRRTRRSTELGLSSLERVELMMALEEALEVTSLDEGGDSPPRRPSPISKSLAPPFDDAHPPTARSARSNREGRSTSRPGTVAGRVVVAAREPADLDPAARPRVRVDEGRRPRAPRGPADGPVIFAANHQSHMDTPVILEALPGALALSGAPAMAKEFFKAHFFPTAVQPQGLSPTASTTTCRRSSSTRSRCRSARPARGRRCATSATCFSGGLLVLIFPEGKRTGDGEINPVPGRDRDDRRPRLTSRSSRSASTASTRSSTTPGSWRSPAARVAFGAPMSLAGDDYAAAGEQVEDAVRLRTWSGRLCRVCGPASMWHNL